MRRSALLFLFLVTFALPARAQTEVVLPVEVMGLSADLTDASSLVWSASRTLPVSSVPAGTDTLRLHMQVNNLVYAGQVLVRANNGPWHAIGEEVDLSRGVDIPITCDPKSRVYRCLGVGADSLAQWWGNDDEQYTRNISFSLPLPELQAGQNNIDFAFGGTDGVTTVARVFEIDVRSESGQSVLGDVTWVYDYRHSEEMPERLQGEPDSTVAKWVLVGGEAWHKRNFIFDFGGQHPIVGACADCHASDGRDLDYFNYSNASIYNRSRFHNLGDSLSTAITAYIRSRVFRDQDGNIYQPKGTPWDPPYQPGPTALATREPGEPRTAGQSFDEIGQEHWAAGAGLEWVLEDDRDMLPYLFDLDPNAEVTPELIAAAQNVHHDSTLVMRLDPISSQLPTWNEWLPDISPFDAMGDAYTNPGCSNCDVHDLVENSLYQAYENDPGLYPGPVNNISPRSRNFTDWWDSTPAYQDDPVGERRLGKKLAFYQFGLVKGWDVLHRYHLENALEQQGYGEVRQWPDDIGRLAFELGPHVSSGGCSVSETPPCNYGDPGSDQWFTHVWYQIQAQNGWGNKVGAGQGQFPVDVGYQFNFIGSAEKATGLSFTYRRIQSYMKGQQQLLGSWSPKFFYPARYAREFSTMAPHYEADMVVGAEGGYFQSEAMKRAVIERSIRSWVEGMRDRDLDDYVRSTSSADLWDEDGVYDHYSTWVDEGRLPYQETDFSAYFRPYAWSAQNVLRTLPWLAEQGLDTLANDIARFGSDFWPASDDVPGGGWTSWFLNADEKVEAMPLSALTAAGGTVTRTGQSVTVSGAGGARRTLLDQGAAVQGRCEMRRSCTATMQIEDLSAEAPGAVSYLALKDFDGRLAPVAKVEMSRAGRLRMALRRGLGLADTLSAPASIPLTGAAYPVCLRLSYEHLTTPGDAAQEGRVTGYAKANCTDPSAPTDATWTEVDTFSWTARGLPYALYSVWGRGADAGVTITDVEVQ